MTQGSLDGKYHPDFICIRDQMPVYSAQALGLLM